MLNKYTFQKDAMVKVKKLVFLFHGLGANGQDLLGLAPNFSKELPDSVLFISPDAPEHCDMAPPSYEGSYQWFSLQDRAPQAIAKNVEAAAPVMQQYIEKLTDKFGLGLSDVALVGFSQGSMMSLHAGLRLPKPVAGVLAYSGAMAVPPEEGCHKTKITLVHGTSDDVVPSHASQSAQEILSAESYESELYLRPGLAHGIDPEGIKIGIKFLNSILT